MACGTNMYIATCFGLCVRLDDFCSDKEDAVYEIDYNCSAYYRCVQGETFVHLCPEGLIFSKARKQCLPPFRVPERAEECAASPRYLLSALICNIYLLFIVICCRY